MTTDRMTDESKKEYFKITFDGTVCITETEQTFDSILESFGGPEQLGIGEKITIEKVELTDKEFEELDDFNGF